MGLQHYTQDMSKIPLKYHKKVLFYTKYTHPTLICSGTDGQTDRRTDRRTDGRTENIYSIFRDKLLLLGEHGFHCQVDGKRQIRKGRWVEHKCDRHERIRSRNGVRTDWEFRRGQKVGIGHPHWWHSSRQEKMDGRAGEGNTELQRQ